MGPSQPSRTGTVSMRRFSSTKYALAETRHILRDRFPYYLPITQSTPGAPKPGNLLPDEQLLELLLGLNVHCESDIDRARATSEAARCRPLAGTLIKKSLFLNECSSRQ